MHFTDVTALSWNSPYSWRDGVVQIKGSSTGSENPDTLIGPVATFAPMGSRTVQLSTLSSGIQVGMWVRILMSDVNGTLIHQLYGSAMDKSGCGQECSKDLTGQEDLVRWMTRVASVDGTSITLQRPLPVAASPEWKAQLHRVPDAMPKNSGVRGLTVEFAWSPAAQHHKEQGYNAFFIDSAVNSFLVDVEAVNVDSGVIVSNSFGVSVLNSTVRSSTPRGEGLPFEGHIGIGAYDSSDVEVGFFDLQGERYHDLTVRGTLFTVFYNGRGDNVNLDTHRSAPYATLFSNIYMGKGTRPFGTGGYLSRGFPAAKYTTYYNLRSARAAAFSMPGSTVAGVSRTHLKRFLSFFLSFRIRVFN